MFNWLHQGLIEMMKLVDDNEMVREKVCHSLNYVLLQYRCINPDLLVPQMDTIVKVKLINLSPDLLLNIRTILTAVLLILERA